MKTLKQFILEASKPSTSTMRDWVYRNLENTEKTHDQMKKEFVQKFGAQNVKYFDQYVSAYMD